MTIIEAIDNATDHGVTVTAHYTTTRKGQKVGAFKCLKRGVKGASVEVKQTEPKSRTWTICQRGFSVFYGSQAEFINKAVEWLS